MHLAVATETLLKWLNWILQDKKYTESSLFDFLVYQHVCRLIHPCEIETWNAFHSTTAAISHWFQCCLSEIFQEPNCFQSLHDFIQIHVETLGWQHTQLTSSQNATKGIPLSVDPTKGKDLLSHYPTFKPFSNTKHYENTQHNNLTNELTSSDTSITQPTRQSISALNLWSWLCTAWGIRHWVNDPNVLSPLPFSIKQNLWAIIQERLKTLPTPSSDHVLSIFNQFAALSASFSTPNPSLSASFPPRFISSGEMHIHQTEQMETPSQPVTSSGINYQEIQTLTEKKNWVPPTDGPVKFPLENPLSQAHAEIPTISQEASKLNSVHPFKGLSSSLDTSHSALTHFQMFQTKPLENKISHFASLRNKLNRMNKEFDVSNLISDESQVITDSPDETENTPSVPNITENIKPFDMDLLQSLKKEVAELTVKNTQLQNFNFNLFEKLKILEKKLMHVSIQIDSKNDLTPIEPSQTSKYHLPAKSFFQFFVLKSLPFCFLHQLSLRIQNLNIQKREIPSHLNVPNETQFLYTSTLSSQSKICESNAQKSMPNYLINKNYNGELDASDGKNNSSLHLPNAAYQVSSIQNDENAKQPYFSLDGHEHTTSAYSFHTFLQQTALKIKRIGFSHLELAQDLEKCDESFMEPCDHTKNNLESTFSKTGLPYVDQFATPMERSQEKQTSHLQAERNDRHANNFFPTQQHKELSESTKPIFNTNLSNQNQGPVSNGLWKSYPSAFVDASHTIHS